MSLAFYYRVNFTNYEIILKLYTKKKNEYECELCSAVQNSFKHAFQLVG